MIEVTADAEGSVVAVLAHPGAKRNGVLGERAGSVRVAVTVPPDKGKANAAIERVLADCLGCKVAQVRLVSGATSRHKRFLVAGVGVVELRERLGRVIDPPPLIAEN
jgi:uncharacterized protein (TIGR00251 family)